MSDIKLEGVKELAEQLKTLPDKVRRKAMRQASRAAANAVAKKARAAITVGDQPHITYKGRLVSPGFAKRNIAVDVRVSKDLSFASARIGPKREAFYATAFLELGTSRTAAQPWLVPSFEQAQSEIIQIYTSKLRQAIEQATR